jgi:hypothetical protein
MFAVRVVFAAFIAALGTSATHPLEYRLDRQMKGWQKRMGMDEWNLSLRVARVSELDRNAWGTAEWDPERKTGTIRVLDPRDYNLRGGELKLDMECTIVHELVHIQVSPLAAPDERVREDIVNKIMHALVNRPCPN